MASNAVVRRYLIMLSSREAMTASRKQPGVAFWVTVVVVVVLVAYPLSFGPVYWLELRGWLPSPVDDVHEQLYSPVIWFANECAPWNRPYWWYLSLGIPADSVG